MEYDISDCASDLIDSEHLKIFNVVDKFCDQCGDLTPHHLDEPKKEIEIADSQNTHNFQEDHEVQIVKPVSLHECVYCREEEECRIE